MEKEILYKNLSVWKKKLETLIPDNENDVLKIG